MRYRPTGSGVLVPASFAESSRPPAGEVATTLGGRDITRGFVAGNLIEQPEDQVLLSRGGGDLRLYEELLRDDQVHMAFQQRRLAVVSAEWEVDPGGKRARDKAAAEFLREQLKRIRFDALTDKMLYGVFYGYAVAELLYARDGAQVVIDAVKVRNRRRFGFHGSGELVLRTASAPQGERLPTRKFWMFQTGADHDDAPYGLGLGHWLYWPVFFKRNGIKFWLIFLEKFGQPTAKGTYPSTASTDERSKLLQALEAISTESGVIVPEGMMVELLEAARSGTADYTALHDRMNAAISKVIVGQTMTGDQGSSRAQAQVHMEVRQDLVKADADLVCESFNLTVARWLTQWNFPNAAPPRVFRRIEEPEDLNQLATRDKTLTEIGYRPSLDRITEIYGEGYENTGVPAAQPPGAQPPPAQSAFAEADAEDPPAQMVDRLDDRVAPALDAWIGQIKQLVESAESLEQIRDGLLELYPDMSLDDYAQAMAEALAAASLAGRSEILDQANGRG